MTESISSRLEYFQELEHATRMLNHPGESLVLQPDFLYMVERVDICIDFLKAHVRLSPLVLFSSHAVPHTPAKTSSPTAPLQRIRTLPPPLRTMPDPRNDAHQDVLRRLPQGTR